MSTFTITIDTIPESGKEISFSIPASWLDEVMAETGIRGVPEEAGEAKLRAHRVGDDIALSGQLAAPLVAACVRCLEDVRIDAKTKVSLLFSPRASAPRLAEELELTPEDLDREYHDGVSLVLDDIVRENLILEVPMQPLCRADCPGIPIPEHLRPPEDFSAVDPRLAPLRDLRETLPKGESSK